MTVGQKMMQAKSWKNGAKGNEADVAFLTFVIIEANMTKAKSRIRTVSH